MTTPRRRSRPLALLLLGAVLAALAYAVFETASTGEDWLELAVIGAAALIGGLALGARREPRPDRRRTIVRTPESRW